MKAFGLLLGLAFVDLGIAGYMASRGDRGIALLFILIAVATAGFALVSVHTVRRNPRGRLETVEPPFAKVLGFVGAAAILGAAAYVATATTRPKTPDARIAPAASRSVAAPAWTPPPRPKARAADRVRHLLYKCEDASGSLSFQSHPCAPGSREVWVRDASPEPEPTPAQLARMRRAREAARPSPRAGGGWTAPDYAGQESEQSAACRAARAADAAYRRQPLSQVKHDGLRRHGDAVKAACY